MIDDGVPNVLETTSRLMYRWRYTGTLTASLHLQREWEFFWCIIDQRINQIFCGHQISTNLHKQIWYEHLYQKKLYFLQFFTGKVIFPH